MIEVEKILFDGEEVELKEYVRASDFTDRINDLRTEIGLEITEVASLVGGDA